MQVGYVLKKEMAVQGGDGEITKKSYLEMTIRTLFGGIEVFTISKNKTDNTNAPEYNIYAHNPKGWMGRKVKVGALWLKSLDDGTQFLSGHIETPVAQGGKIQVSLWRAKPLFDGEEVAWEYDVVWKPYNPQAEQTKSSIPVTVMASSGGYPDVDIPDDEIPF